MELLRVVKPGHVAGIKGSQWRRQTAEIARRADSQQTRSDTALYKSQLFIIIIKAEEALKKGGHEALVACGGVTG